MGILRMLISKIYWLRMQFSKRTGMGMSVTTNEKKIIPLVSIYNINASTNSGQEISFQQYRGKKILLVNLASKCGFTPQYNELEKLQQLNKDKITILGFPSDDFGGQEPGNDDEIAEFCKINYGVTFQLFHKDHVKGFEKQPVYQWLCNAAKNGWNNNEPTWNFCKYLVDENGHLLKVFSSSVSPLSKSITESFI